MGPFLGLFWFRFRSFLAFFRVFALGCVISFSCCACRVLFWSWVRAAFFSVGLLCVFLFVFSLLFVLFFGPFLVLGAGRRAAFF